MTKVMMMIMMMMVMMMMPMIEEGEEEEGEEERGAPSLQNEDPTPQDGWEKTSPERCRETSPITACSQEAARIPLHGWTRFPEHDPVACP